MLGRQRRFRESAALEALCSRATMRGVVSLATPAHLKRGGPGPGDGISAREAWKAQQGRKDELPTAPQVADAPDAGLPFFFVYTPNWPASRRAFGINSR